MQPKQSNGEPGSAKVLQVGRSSARHVPLTHGLDIGDPWTLRFVEDVTVPDGTSVVADTRLTKIWKIRNAVSSGNSTVIV